MPKTLDKQQRSCVFRTSGATEGHSESQRLGASALGGFADLKQLAWREPPLF
ncbi:MAG: hypothetical protein KME21_15140 [Desmonostoc vinosum HA7617-LM4]|nr:hypothetical protein [Desmonostoc vinosum HA7617-LM4]